MRAFRWVPASSGKGADGRWRDGMSRQRHSVDRGLIDARGQSMKASERQLGQAVALGCLAMVLLAGCANTSRKVGRDPGEVTFPDPQRARPQGGTYINLQNLRQVAPGLSKAQIYALLGTPQFNEGLFGVHRWNYVFKFHDDSGEVSCQYQLQFDGMHRVQAMYWKPQQCSERLQPPAAPTIAETRTVLPKEPIRLSADALFEFNKDQLNEQGRQSLASLLPQIREASAEQDIAVIGYTDRLGSDAYNLALSLRRARAVADYLVMGGVAAGSIHAQGLGDSAPVVACDQSQREALIACLAPNRRVELSGISRAQ
jgi:outer membrane protein OmpA-like peptidoglycan-associated protein